MKTRRILSTILALTMLLTLFGGEFASAAGMKIVTAGEELAYDPLAETASVAYEQHDAGYAVSLDRAADSVTMHVTAVPGSRGADKARLYVRTGVALKAGVAYRVSFALSSEKQLADYTVNFDGDTAAAYGKLDKRSIEAGATDRVEYAFTPKAASGELVLRLLLGTTEVNTLRFSDLAVEEAPAEQSGANKLLVDKLNYAAPGAIRCAAEAGYSAEMSSTDTSATMTVTNVPKSGAEVWKLKLMVSTGLKPEPGKTYRFRATLNASNSGSYEACYNEGEVEKGYDVLYNQSLKSGNQTVERMIYVPTDKENPGELIVQFSLGKLSKGTKVTISKVTVEEASPAYTNALARDFALDATEEYNVKYYETGITATSSTAEDITINWDSDAVITTAGNYRGTVTRNATSATMQIAPGSNGIGDAMLHIHTGVALESNTTYCVTLNVAASQYHEKYNVLFGSGFGVDGSGNLTWDNNKKYECIYNRTLPANTTDPVKHQFNTGENPGTLMITLEVGNATGSVTVSDLTIRKVTETLGGSEMLALAYPRTNYSVVNESNNKSTASTYGNAIKLQVTSAHGTDFHTKLIFHTGITTDSDKSYRVNFKIKRAESGNNDNWWSVNLGNAGQYQDTKYGSYNKDQLGKITTEYTEKTMYIPGRAGDGNKLYIFLMLGRDVDTYWVKDVTVTEYTATYVTASEKFDYDYNNSTLSQVGDKAKLEVSTGTDDYKTKLVFDSGITTEAGHTYRITFKIKRGDSNNNTKWWLAGLGGPSDKTVPNRGSDNKDVLGEITTDEQIKTLTKEVSDAGHLYIILQLGACVDTYWVSDVTVSDVTSGISVMSSQPNFGSYRVGALEEGAATPLIGGMLNGDGSSATLTCTGGQGEWWKRALFVDNICTLNAGSKYMISFDVSASESTGFNVLYNRDADYGDDMEAGFGEENGKTADSTLRTVEHMVTAAANGSLRLRLNLGDATENTQVTVKNIKVQQYTETQGDNLFTRKFSEGSVSFDSQYATKSMDKTSTSATLHIADASDKADWKAKMYVDTGFTPQPDKSYRVSFNIKGSAPQDKFHIFYGYGDAATEKIYGEKYEVPVSTAETTVVHDIYTNSGTGSLVIELLLGLLDGTSNDFTVSDVRVFENTIGLIPTGGKAGITGTVDVDMQPGYTVPLTRAKDSATVAINATPATGMEAWKHKLFIDTGVDVNEGEAYRVVFDTLAENDMDFEVCYNRGNTEKGFAAIYGLHAAAGKTKTVEKMVFAEDSGKLIVQLSLGMVAAPNKVTVSNLRVDRAQYSYSGKSALPAEISYQAGDVSYWAHADYAASFTNTADSVTAHITPPAKSPEPWKVKLFLDTGVALEGGKYYKVTTDVSAKKSQNYEICYNNGGVEFGYDSMGGLKVTGGRTERIEKLISVPAGKKDTNNLMLQFNLGKTSIANEVTIGGVTVEEVTLAYADALGKDFSYQKSLSTWTDPKTSYKAAVDSTAEGATLHISDVPASGTGVWMVKLFVHTGAMLEAGKSYQVSADLLAAKAQDFETCFNNEETEKGFDAIYGQKLAAGAKTTVDKRISVPASMTDAGELVLQFSVGGTVANDITVSNVSVQELQYGGSGDASPVPDTVIALNQSAQAAGTLDVTREKLVYHMTKIAADAKDNAIQIAGAALRSNDLYTVAFTAKADKELTGTLALAPSGGKSAVISKPFTLTTTEQTYSFTTADALAEGGAYDVFWQFGSADNQKLGSADVELSGISVSVPTERLEVVRSVQKVTVNGKAVSPDIYNINGSNYFKLRDLAVLLNGTNGQFVVRYNPQTNGVSLTTDKAYTPIGGELMTGPDLAATCVRSPQDVTVNGKAVNLKVYNIGGSNFFRLRDLNELLGFDVDYEAKTNTVLIASPLTPERQEASYAYNVFFRPEIDGESQPYVGDTMPFYDNGTYYIYYLKEGGDSYNHSVYLTTTRDFVSYREYDDPVLSASRADVQDSWIGTGSVVKADKDYYFFYTGFNASGSQEYHEKIMVAKGSSPTSFTKVGGWSITPPAELNQKNDFRDPQAYYDPATGTISLTVTASKDGTARILKYTLGKDLSSVKYDGVIFTDPTGAFYNLECSDTFRLGNKWYLTYSGQEDTLWYASADSRFGPYSAPKRMDGAIFYAAKHVENGKNSYMVGWTRRSTSASSTDEVSGWGGNLAVQQLRQNADGSLSMIPADSIASAFSKSVASSATSATLTAGSGYSYKKAFTSSESFKLTGEFTCAGTGSLGLAFDFDGTEDQYKLISVDPAEGKLKLLFNGGATQIAETQAKVAANQKHTFTYIQDGSVGIFYLDGQAALTVRLYGVTDKPIYLFAENNSVTFTSLRQFTR